MRYFARLLTIVYNSHISSKLILSILLFCYRLSEAAVRYFTLVAQRILGALSNYFVPHGDVFDSTVAQK